MQIGGGIGVAAKATSNWQATAEGTAQAYRRVSSAMTLSRQKRGALARRAKPVSNLERSAAFEFA